jgi:hypothetical protein
LKHFNKKIFQKDFQQRQDIEGMLEIKPRNENQEYLAHFVNFKTLSHRGLGEDIV